MSSPASPVAWLSIICDGAMKRPSGDASLEAILDVDRELNRDAVGVLNVYVAKYISRDFIL